MHNKSFYQGVLAELEKIATGEPLSNNPQGGFWSNLGSNIANTAGQITGMTTQIPGIQQGVNYFAANAAKEAPLMGGTSPNSFVQGFLQRNKGALDSVNSSLADRTMGFGTYNPTTNSNELSMGGGLKYIGNYIKNNPGVALGAGGMLLGGAALLGKKPQVTNVTNNYNTPQPGAQAIQPTAPSSLRGQEG